jgi:hypothetical protein
MLAKLMIIIVAAGITASALLVARQRQIELVHDMTKVHARVLDHRRALWQLHLDVAQRCRPDRVRDVAERIEIEWIPIPHEPVFPNQSPSVAVSHAHPPSKAQRVGG